MTIVDTTVLNYALGGEHQLRKPSQRLLERHANGTLQLTTTVEVIQEFTHVYSRRRPRVTAVELARAYSAAFPLLVTTQADLELGLSLYEDTAKLGAFDAVLAAVAINNRVEALISADRAFGDVVGLRWLDPASSAVADLA